MPIQLCSLIGDCGAEGSRTLTGWNLKSTTDRGIVRSHGQEAWIGDEIGAGGSRFRPSSHPKLAGEVSYRRR